MCSAYHLPSPGCSGTVIWQQDQHTCMSYSVSSGLLTATDEDDLSDQLLCAFKLCCELYGKFQLLTCSGMGNISVTFVKNIVSFLIAVSFFTGLTTLYQEPVGLENWLWMQCVFLFLATRHFYFLTPYPIH